jgi:hypothetical protein
MLNYAVISVKVSTGEKRGFELNLAAESEESSLETPACQDMDLGAKEMN